MMEVTTLIFLSGMLCLVTLLSIGMTSVRANDEKYKEKIKEEVMRALIPYLLEKYSEISGTYRPSGMRYSKAAEGEKESKDVAEQGERKIEISEEYEPLGFQLFYKEGKEGKPEISQNQNDLSVPSLVYGDPSKIYDRIKGWFDKVREKYGEIEKSDFAEFAEEKYRERHSELGKLIQTLHKIYEAYKDTPDLLIQELNAMIDSVEKYEYKVELLKEAYRLSHKQQHNKEGIDSTKKIESEQYSQTMSKDDKAVVEGES